MTIKIAAIKDNQLPATPGLAKLIHDDLNKALHFPLRVPKEYNGRKPQRRGNRWWWLGKDALSEPWPTRYGLKAPVRERQTLYLAGGLCKAVHIQKTIDDYYEVTWQYSDGTRAKPRTYRRPVKLGRTRHFKGRLMARLKIKITSIDLHKNVGGIHSWFVRYTVTEYNEDTD